MTDVRTTWIDTIERHRLDPDGPGSNDFWSPRLDTISRDELRAMQGEKLQSAVRYAYECIPFYRQKFDRLGLTLADIRSLDDLHRIPITQRQEMAEDLEQNPPWGTYTAIDDAAWRERGWQIFASSGTTGQPRAFRYTAYDRTVWAWADARAMWAMGFRPGRDVALLAFGYGPHVWLWGVHYALNLMGIPILTAGGLDTSARARFVDRYQPTILACTPSYALRLGSVMQEMGLDPAGSSVRYLFCAGEPGYSVPATRQRLEELWDAELHEFYGCTEAAPAAGAFTCHAMAARKDGPAMTHLLEDVQIWEVVDPVTHEMLPDGERGLSVVTNLCSESSPQLRFLVGDFTTLTHEPCPCGRTHARAVGGFLGRADDLLNVRGVTLFPSSVEDAVRRVPGVSDEFAIVLTRDQELDVLAIQVEVQPDIPMDRYDEISRQVEREVRSRCELRPVVEVLLPGTLPPTEFKAKRVRDLRSTP
jgi:phenylacetate-CoA ligase